MPDVLPYRSPHTATDNRMARIVRHLRGRELWGFGRIIAGYVLGVPLCFVAPALITPLFAGTSRYGPLFPSVSTSFIFTVLSLVLVPLLFWYEHRTRGEYFMDALREWGCDGPLYSSPMHRGGDTEGPGAI